MDVSSWTPDQFIKENSRYYLCLQCLSLINAHTLISPDEFERGTFLYKSKLDPKIFHLWMDRLDQLQIKFNDIQVEKFILKSPKRKKMYDESRGRRISGDWTVLRESEDDLSKVFQYLLNERLALNDYFHHRGMVMEANKTYIFSSHWVHHLKKTLREYQQSLDELLADFIGVHKQDVPMYELINKYQYPDVDIEMMELEGF